MYPLGKLKTKTKKPVTLGELAIVWRLGLSELRKRKYLIQRREGGSLRHLRAEGVFWPDSSLGCLVAALNLLYDLGKILSHFVLPFL